MDKKAFALVQHILIPLALIGINLAMCQFIYQLANATNYIVIFCTSVSLVILIVGILRVHRYLLIIGVLLCTLNLIWALL